MSQPIEISVTDLEVWCHIGVTEAERAWPQRLLLSLQLQASLPDKDDISLALDYAKVADLTATCARSRPRQLLETLAQDIAVTLREETGTAPDSVSIKKFVIPSCAHVMVTYHPE